MHKKSGSALKPPNTDEFLTVVQAHEIVGKDVISRRGFYNAVERQEVPSVRLGGRLLIPRRRFMQWIESAGNRRSGVTGR